MLRNTRLSSCCWEGFEACAAGMTGWYARAKVWDRHLLGLDDKEGRGVDAAGAAGRDEL